MMTPRQPRVLAFLWIALVFSASSCTSSPPISNNQGEGTMSIHLTSERFSDGGTIPRQYTCDGENLSPPLSWTGVPDETQSLALIVDDPDAPSGTWVHWVIFNLPADLSALPEGVTMVANSPDLGTQGNNDFRKSGYGGPCPPAGTAHRYFFKLYALDTRLSLASGATKADLEKAMQGHVLDKGQLIGKYGR
jgi:Raf kinase inhibitor-like YbhB/YbcL family protein